MQRKIETISINGQSLEYSIIGDGKPILVFHGGHSNCHEEFGYDALVEKGYSLITPSRAGYGATSKEIGENLAVACTIYMELLRYLKIETVHVLAISAGGPTGIYFASTYPEIVKSLTLQSAVTKEWLTPQDIEYKAAKLLFRPITEKMTWKLIATMSNLFPSFIFRQMFGSFSKLSYKEAKKMIREEDIEAIRKMNNRQRSGCGFFIDLDQTKELTKEQLQEIKCPTFIMYSKNDGSVSLEHPNYAHEHIPHSELCFLNTWGHLIWLGNTSHVTNEKYLSFLGTFANEK
ncbi:alpha/beta fold hydrolase [Metabacillus malikii]|uniref:Pimeloyl-ACP methyl ester carboxylesterase n=1 Tax=Metabacillus malikii TaxID=1504265 RepID=A0ABT9ZJB4_9BACI|nr:alpha/beta hydrolase [Metabacillus malikii]MDQ0232080.1 pimeloyl-ACP methyl ester carboxylesterase [Metabacillus malikii]